MSCMLTTLTKKKDVDSIIRDTIDKVLVLRIGRAADSRLDGILAKTAREVSKFATVALVDIDSVDVQVYVKYFDITLVPSTVFFFNAHHMKMDSGYQFFTPIFKLNPYVYRRIIDIDSGFWRVM